MRTVTEGTSRPPRLPPRWFIRAAWAIHRALYTFTGGRVGISRATEDRPGTLRLRTVGRRSGKERRAILGYIQDGPNMVTTAMNGWGDPDPAWWLNLQARPDAMVDFPGQSIPVRGREADDDERARLWPKLGGDFSDLDRYAALRSRKTAVVILEPRSSND
jgi:deazaflavin-dependent oxidoreductase (nitroreductase family)